MAVRFPHGLGVALMTLAMQAGAATITGTATYADRSALPPEATLEITVEDVSLADAPAKIVGRLVRMPAGQVPIRFEVPYVEAAVQPHHRYSLRARITVDGQLRYISTTHTPVLTMGGKTADVEVQLQRVNAATPYAGTPGTTAGGSLAPGGPARADAPPKPDRSLVNTYWKLVDLRGAPVVVTPNQREPHLILQIEANRVVGSGGCNRLSGTYTLNGDFVGFGGMAATRMACPGGGMEQEAAFLQTLGDVKSWRVRGDDLALLDASNATLLKFVAVDLR